MRITPLVRRQSSRRAIANVTTVTRTRKLPIRNSVGTRIASLVIAVTPAASSQTSAPASTSTSHARFPAATENLTDGSATDRTLSGERPRDFLLRGVRSQIASRRADDERRQDAVLAGPTYGSLHWGGSGRWIASADHSSRRVATSCNEGSVRRSGCANTYRPLTTRR